MISVCQAPLIVLEWQATALQQQVQSVRRAYPQVVGRPNERARRYCAWYMIGTTDAASDFYAIALPLTLGQSHENR